MAASSDATLIKFSELWHSPQFEVLDVFHPKLLEVLNARERQGTDRLRDHRNLKGWARYE